jgi:hypothetical protein
MPSIRSSLQKQSRLRSLVYFIPIVDPVLREEAAVAAAGLPLPPAAIVFLLALPSSTCRTRLAKLSEQKVSSALYSTGLMQTVWENENENVIWSEAKQCYGG